MPRLNSLIIRSPIANDIVDDPIQISGIAVAFEGTFQTRVRDQDGNILKEQFFTAAGGTAWRNFQIILPLDGVPPTPSGTLELFEFSAENGDEINKVVIPIVFGRALVDPYFGFSQYEVNSGDTLSAIAQQFYGDRSLSDRIFQANRDQLNNPNTIFPGQFLRIPQ
ncbi:MAG: Gmad2 immunoglobulin-like domain-containing protein [Phormidesmis sp.]